MASDSVEDDIGVDKVHVISDHPCTVRARMALCNKLSKRSVVKVHVIPDHLCTGKA